jgi:hypothetical protein
MENPINWKIISHPINWIVILLMLIIAGTAGHMILSLFGAEPASMKQNPNLAVGQSTIGLPSNQGSRSTQ